MSEEYQSPLNAEAESGDEDANGVHNEIVQESLRLFDMAYKSQQEIRLKCLQDRRFVFVDGAQWEDALRLQFDNKPRFEINKLHLACIRIFNEYRNNRISVDFRPKDDDADDETADFLDNLYRADEANGGQEAFDNAFEEGVAGGMGALRLRNIYEDEEDEDNDQQRIVFEPIFDADSSVFWSLDGKRYDKRDASYCWVITSMGRDEYAEKYGGNPEGDPFANAALGQPATFRRIVKMTEFDWYTPDVVYVAEFYRKEKQRRKVHVFRMLGNNSMRDVKVPDEELDAQERADLEAQGFTHIRTRTVTRTRVHKWIHDGERVLEDCGFIAGRNIPIVPFYGKRAFIDNQERIQGHIRNGKDSQRLLNMQTSLLAIIAALSPRAKPVFTPEQIRGHEMTWANDNIADKPYLLVNPVTDINGNESPAPLMFTQPPTVPPALATMIELTNADIKELLAEQEAGEQMVSNVSAQAVEMVQSHVDMMAFIYMDNMAKTVARAGEIWLDMASECYDEEGRRMQTVAPDGTRGSAKLKTSKIVDGATKTVNDPSKGKYEVVVDVGPAFRSRRDATVRSLVGMLQFIQDPQLASIITSLVITNMDGEGLGDVREFMRMRLISQGIVKPNEKEAKEIQQQEAQKAAQPPSPHQMLVQAELGFKNAEIAEKHANTVKTLADSANSRADAVARLADSHTTRLKMALDILQTLITQTPEDAQAAGLNSPVAASASQTAQSLEPALQAQ